MLHFVNQTNSNLKASITPHHLMINRSDMLEHKIKPHYYCLPILKRKKIKSASEMATSGNENFFLGTDPASHRKTKKMRVVVQEFLIQLILLKC